MSDKPNITSHFIQYSEARFRVHNAEVIALLGRDDTDSYNIAIEPESKTAEFRPSIWGLVTQSSYFSRYLNWFSVFVKSRTPNSIWVGVEVVVPHPTRTAYLEACLGLCDLRAAIACLKEFAELPIISTLDQHNNKISYYSSNNETQIIFCNNNFANIITNYIETLNSRKIVFGATTVFGDNITTLNYQYDQRKIVKIFNKIYEIAKTEIKINIFDNPNYDPDRQNKTKKN